MLHIIATVFDTGVERLPLYKAYPSRLSTDELKCAQTGMRIAYAENPGLRIEIKQIMVFLYLHTTSDSDTRIHVSSRYAIYILISKERSSWNSSANKCREISFQQMST